MSAIGVVMLVIMLTDNNKTFMGRVLTMTFLCVLMTSCTTNGIGTSPLITYKPSFLIRGWYQFDCNDKWIKNQWWASQSSNRTVYIVPHVPTMITAIEACHVRGLKPKEIIRMIGLNAMH